MEKNKINFITGETYTLAELFSGNRRIVIPDLQRDYCWGDETNQKSSGVQGELVTDFINNLIEQYDEQTKEREVSPLNLGLLYGYEVPANHIQLCDGQQRLTTLYLLLGMLNKKTGKFRQYLISDYKFNQDDKEPYLNYAIRESSLYFLSDLVCRFFISNDDTVSSIATADWYFNNYNLDPSICSMINALKKIEEILQKQENKLDYGAFGDWLLNKLTFLYFDMVDRKNGEETFVIINTTGEPLSVTQNLKPLVITAEKNKGIVIVDEKNEEKGIDKAWEDIETWFWKNRQGENDTADAGFEEFLRWVSIIEQKDEKLSEEDKDQYLIQQILRGEGNCEFPYNNISFETIYRYWKALIWVMDEKQKQIFPFNKEILSPKINKDVNGRKAIGQNDCFVLLPVLSFVYKKIDAIKKDENLQRNAKRIYEFFANLIRIDNVSKSINSLVYEVLHVVDLLDENGDILSILKHPNDISKQILTDEEKCKLEILRENMPHNEQDTSPRKHIEEAFWEIQRHEVWQGEIMPLIESANVENGEFNSSKFTLDVFEKSVHIFRLLFCNEDQHDDIIHLLRRCAILCAEPCEPYKLAIRGSYYTFGWTWNDWNKILCTPNSHHSRMKYLFNYLLEQTKEETIKDITMCKLKEILENFINESKTQNDYVEFAKDDYLLSFTKKSKACDMCWEGNDWQISFQGGRGKGKGGHTGLISRRNTYILKEFGGSYKNDEKQQLSYKNWGIWYWGENSYRSNCVVFECVRGFTMDVRFLSKNMEGCGTLEIEFKPTDNKDISTRFSNIIEELSKEMKVEEGKYIRKDYQEFNPSEIHNYVKDIMSKVDAVN